LKAPLLLDSHILLWWLSDDRRLSKAARVSITDAEMVYISAITAWELTIKSALGKLRVPDDLEKEIGASGFTPLPLTVAHAVAAGKLPPHHNDPFDRMLIAQATLESLTLVTSDTQLSAYQAALLLV
jgi:PIN domain nuclease of toxin-antitoxin system